MKTEPIKYSDEELWRRLKAGDKQSFNLLFTRHYSQLYYYGFKIISDSEYVKENIQEIFMRIWETRESLANVMNVKSYLLVSLRRLLLTNKIKTRRGIELVSSDGLEFHFDENEFEKHQEVSDHVRTTLLTAVNSLTKKQREIVMLFFFHELGYKEISQVMDMSVQAARNLMYRTLINLRETLGPKSLNTLKDNFFLLFSLISFKKDEII